MDEDICGVAIPTYDDGWASNKFIQAVGGVQLSEGHNLDWSEESNECSYIYSFTMAISPQELVMGEVNSIPDAANEILAGTNYYYTETDAKGPGLYYYDGEEHIFIGGEQSHIEVRSDDPSSPEAGRIWLNTSL